MIIFGLCEKKKILTGSVSEEEPADGVAGRDA
jgi:hypothetical protein